MEAITPLYAELGTDPWSSFLAWYQEALQLNTPNPNSVLLATQATNSDSATPNCRIVLLKEVSQAEGFVFYTNYISDKSQELNTNPNCCLHFFWDELGRQVKVVGIAEKVDYEENEAYFKTRPRLSQLTAWSSRQSRVLKNRDEFLARTREYENKFAGGPVTCPPFWGGWRVMPFKFEFWRVHAGRQHERLVYTEQDKSWHVTLLYP